MADAPGPLTSEALARAMGTNPVVVRRLLGGLRRRGLVASGKGHGGGWTLRRPPQEITLLDVYEALGRPPLMAMGNRRGSPHCLVERAVNDSVTLALRDAERLLLDRFAEVTLAGLDAERRERLGATGRHHSPHPLHGHPAGCPSQEHHHAP